MIGVVDYGLGNVRAILNIYERAGIPASAVRTPEELKDAGRLILPGVGSFDWAMDRLTRSGMREELDRRVLREGALVLGICVGMQMMMEVSEEGSARGLGWFEGEVRRLRAPEGQTDLHLPHMGWNDAAPEAGSVLFAGTATPPRYYFLHSFVVHPRKASDVHAVTEYGPCFPAAVGRDNIFGVQFHPEKSHGWGVTLLERFARMAPC